MKDHPAVVAALNEWRRINATRNQWARFEAYWLPGHMDPTVILTIGSILSGGFKEDTLMSYSYYLDHITKAVKRV